MSVKHAMSSLTLWALCGACLAQDAPAAVTGDQVRSYQDGVERGCKNQGYRRGDPRDSVDAFCDCMIAHLKAGVSFAEWQRAYYYAARADQDSEKRIFAPHLADLASCKRTS